MAHCPYERLLDLEPVLAAVRGWEGVRERSPGVFYVKRLPFLHFHVKGDARWADVRDGRTWGTKLDIPTGAPASARAEFLAALERRSRATLAAGARPSA